MIKNKIKFLSIAMLCAIGVSSCKQGPDFQESEYQDLKKMSYSSMSSDEKVTFKTGLVSKLRTDPDFKAYNKLLNAQADAIHAASKDRHAKGIKLAKPDELKKMGRRERLVKRGIKDPDTYEKNTFLALFKIAAVAKKFPELKGLDKKTFTEVLKQASAPSPKNQIVL